MRRIATAIMAMLVGMTSFAASISRDEAKISAMKFFNGAKDSDLTLVWNGNSDESPAFYVFNRKGGGFVIISGEEAVSPVLGYSYENNFGTPKDMPANIKGWFGSLEKDIRAIKSRNITPERKVLDEWACIGARTKGGSSLKLETAEWNQTAPYNDLCVLPDGKKGLTGCVATAMAIFLRYMKYPAKGKGHINSYTTDTNHYSMEGYDIDDHNYDWENMPIKDRAVRNGSTEQKFQVAQLIHDCGMMVEMDYTTSGSGASSFLIPEKLARHLGYNASALCCEKAIYTPTEWLKLIKDELAKNHPVMYAAQDANGGGGHEFIIDGYDENDRLSVNWGWGGSSNGYFSIELSVDGYRFSEGQDAILFIDKDPEGLTSARSQISMFNSGISVTSGRIAEKSSFSLKVNSIRNQGSASYTGNVIPAVFDAEDKVKERIGSPVELSIKATTGGAYYYESVNFEGCTIKEQLGFKDKIGILYTSPETGEYEPLRYDMEGGTIGRISAIPNFISVKESYRAGDEYTFELITGGDYISNKTWYFDGAKKTTPSVVLTPGKHEIKVVLTKPSGKETIIQEIEVK